MARWSAPGYVDCMPGTSSDVVFADASLHRTLRPADELAAYDSALRNASVPSNSDLTGRKGIGRGRFVGWISTEVAEGLAWTMDNACGDAALSLWSGRLAVRARSLLGERPGLLLPHEQELVDRLAEFEANEAWFANRGLVHQRMFDPRVGFYQGRTPNGDFRVEPADFDPHASTL